MRYKVIGYAQRVAADFFCQREGAKWKKKFK